MSVRGYGSRALGTGRRLRQVVGVTLRRGVGERQGEEDGGGGRRCGSLNDPGRLGGQQPHQWAIELIG